MIKIRLKRVKRLDSKKYFNSAPMDNGFVEGRLYERLKKGNAIVFYPKVSHLYLAHLWRTSPIKKITRHKILIAYQTRNSIYHIKKGWAK